MARPGGNLQAWFRRVAEAGRIGRRDLAEGEDLVEGNRVTLLHDGRQCFPAMLEAIARARREILIEMYWFGSDEIGWRFARAVTEKARAGVEVKLIYDAVGSLEADDALFDSLREAGCEVHEFHPIAPWRRRFQLGRVNFRDHRKLLVVDGSVGFCGGVNIGDPWAPPEEGGEGFRDDMVRVEGPAAERMRAVFFDTWHRRDVGFAIFRQGLPPGAEEQTPAVEPSSKAIPSIHPAPFDQGSAVQVITSQFGGVSQAIRAAYLRRIDAAERRIHITNSYFIPDRPLRRALAQAVARGVDVCILLPGVSDVLAVRYASRRLYGQMLKRGIRIHEWGETVLHSKTAIIDDWCTVGTYNLDHRSLFYSLEVTVAIDDAPLAERLDARFQSDLEHSVPIERRRFRYRSLGERLLEQFFYLFRKAL